MKTKISNINILFSIIVFSVLLTSCFKEPEYSNVPTLKFERFELNNNLFSLPGTEDGFIYFEFTDGDGDLGLINTTISGRDTAISGQVVYKTPKYEATFPREDKLSFPEISTNNGVFPKRGEMRINIRSMFDPTTPVTDPRFISKTYDTLTLQFTIIDRAGNVSNIAETSELIIKLR